MVASLRYYKKFINTLKSTVFQLNPYYICVANRLVNDKQQTIYSHMDKFKLSHQDSKVKEKFINTLRDEYESVFEDGYIKVEVIRIKVHD